VSANAKGLKAEELLQISGTDVLKCMSCGRCSASCPHSGDAMQTMPHQFVALLKRGEVEKLTSSDFLWKCLSCFTCVERCPRGVKPAAIVEAARLMVIRQQGEAHISAGEIPELLDPELPQQLLVSVFRKYKA